MWGAEDEKAVEARFQALCERFPEEPPARLRRFFRWCSGNLDNATAMVQRNKEWHGATFPITPTLVEKYLRKGFFFRQGNDLENRPVLVYWGSKLGSVPDDEVDQAILSMAHVLETTMREMTSADHHSRNEFVCIVWIDVGSALNRRMIQSALGMWQANYPNTLHRALITPGTPLAQSLWGMIKWFVSAETREKVMIASGDAVFQQHIHAQHLPTCFGGTVPHIGPCSEAIGNATQAPPPSAAGPSAEELAALREMEQFHANNPDAVAEGKTTEGKSEGKEQSA